MLVGGTGVVIDKEKSIWRRVKLSMPCFNTVLRARVSVLYDSSLNRFDFLIHCGAVL